MIDTELKAQLEMEEKEPLRQLSFLNGHHGLCFLD